MTIKLPPVPPGVPADNPYIWREWFNKLQQILGGITGSISWNLISFTGSNITDIVTRQHNDLQNIQGGTVGDRQHLTTDEVNRIGSERVLLWLSM